MAYNKLTQQEIEKWSNFYLDYVRGYITSPTYQNWPSSEQEKFRKLTAAIYSQMKIGSVSVILLFAGNLSNTFKLLPDDIKQKRHQELDNLTYEEFLNHVKKRIKEHCAARGHYDPNNRLPVATFNQKIKEVPKHDDKVKGDELISQMSDDDIDFVNNFLNFTLLFQELFPDLVSQQTKEFSEEEYQTEWGIIFEDLVKTIEAAEEKWKNRNKSKNPTSGSSSSSQNNLTAEEIEKIVKRLVADKNKLEKEKSNIENQNPNNNNDQEKKLKDSFIAENNRERGEIEKEIDRLLKKSKSQNEENNKNDNKWLVKIAIGLGIAAVVIGVICLIVLLVGRGDKKSNNSKKL